MSAMFALSMLARVTRRYLVIAAGVFLVLPGVAAAADFYAGKTVTVLINYGAGGGTDLEGRLMARHIGKHIPGNPTVVAKNMPGAGGLIALNYLGEAAKKDGLTMGFMAVEPIKQLMKDPAMRVQLQDFAFVAGAHHSGLILLVRSDIAPGMKRPEDIAKAMAFKAGGVNPASIRDTRMRLTLDALGVKYGYVTGYKGGGKVRLALRQNEVQALTEALAPYRARSEAQLVKTGIAIPVCHHPVNLGKGVIEASPNVPEMPTCARLAEKLTGKLPSGIGWDAFNMLWSLSSNMLRFVSLPPGSPKAAVAALREAVAATAKDPAFLAEGRKLMKFQPTFTIGDEGERLLASMLKPQPRIINFLRDYIEAGKKARK